MKKMSLEKMAKINGGFWPMFRVAALIMQDFYERAEALSESIKMSNGVDTGVGSTTEA